MGRHSGKRETYLGCKNGISDVDLKEHLLLGMKMMYNGISRKAIQLEIKKRIVRYRWTATN
jgi:hypothetical protein